MHSMTYPATAHNAVVVGSFITRNQWTTIDGMAVTRTALVGAPAFEALIVIV